MLFAPLNVCLLQMLRAGGGKVNGNPPADDALLPLVPGERHVTSAYAVARQGE